ncbi:hypothetical protein [Enterococcus sp. AZ012]|uniref:hypothetical protein n=1 Tax=unclassified Enterococcus TaxID=2608891 RepID=UPI003D28EDDE
MNRKKVLWLVAVLYLCIIVSMITVFGLINQQRKFIIDLGELNAGLRMINLMLLILTGGLAILTRKILPTGTNDEGISESDKETVDTGPEVKLEERVTELDIEKEEKVEKKEILSIYLSSGESFFHEVDSTGLNSQEIIAAWMNMKPGGELVVEDSDGWSMYVMDQITAITILHC